MGVIEYEGKKTGDTGEAPYTTEGGEAGNLRSNDIFGEARIVVAQSLGKTNYTDDTSNSMSVGMDKGKGKDKSDYRVTSSRRENFTGKEERVTVLASSPEELRAIHRAAPDQSSPMETISELTDPETVGVVAANLLEQFRDRLARAEIARKKSDRKRSVDGMLKLINKK